MTILPGIYALSRAVCGYGNTGECVNWGEGKNSAVLERRWASLLRNEQERAHKGKWGKRDNAEEN